MTDEELKSLIAWNAIAIDNLWKRMDQMSKEAEKRNKEAEKRNKEAEKRNKELDKSMKKMQSTLIWLGVTQWDISEELISWNFQRVFEEFWEEITSFNENMIVYENKKPVAEFDIIWVNGTKVFVCETKTKLTKEHIDKFVNKTLPSFKKYLLNRRFKGLKLHWVMWLRVFKNKEVEKYALKKWLYLIKELHDSNAKMLENSIKSAKEFV